MTKVAQNRFNVAIITYFVASPVRFGASSLISDRFWRGLIRERTRAGLESARAKGRLSGWPRKLTGKDIEAAKALLSGTDLLIEEVAGRVGTSSATLTAISRRRASVTEGTP